MTKPTQAQILRAACQSALDALGRDDPAWAAAQLNSALTAAAGAEQTEPVIFTHTEKEMQSEFNATIERCAQVADNLAGRTSADVPKTAFEEVAAAIRALKDKP